jgi:NADP-reducing hydrogenase subunit HndA
MQKILSNRSTVKNSFKKLEIFINEFSDKQGSLIAILHKAQEIFGYLPREVQEFISEKTGVPVAKIFGVVSFYSFFTMNPKGKYPISVCTGTACYVKGAENVLEEFKRLLEIEVGESTIDGKFSLDALRCVGACSMAPVVTIGEKVYGSVTPEQVKKIISEYK